MWGISGTGKNQIHSSFFEFFWRMHAMRSNTFIWLPHVCQCACCRCSRTIARASHAQHNINETYHTCCAWQKHWWMLHSIALYEHCISKKKSARLASHALLGILIVKCFSTRKSENEEDPIRSYIISHCSITFPSLLQLRAGNRANTKPIPVASVCAASLEDKTLMGGVGGSCDVTASETIRQQKFCDLGDGS